MSRRTQIIPEITGDRTCWSPITCALVADCLRFGVLNDGPRGEAAPSVSGPPHLHPHQNRAPPAAAPGESGMT